MISASWDIGPNLVGVLFAAIGVVKVAVTQKKVVKEFGNNGGSTLRDAVDRIERQGEETHQAVLAIDGRVTRLEEKSS